MTTGRRRGLTRGARSLVPVPIRDRREASRMSDRFHVVPTPIAGVLVLEHRPRGDARGSLTRLFCADGLAACGWTRPIAQINLTRTARAGTLRGLHFQHPPHAETKLVQCLKGAICDVVVDLRAGSPTFLAHHRLTLSADTGHALLVPPGVAHGLQTLVDDVELLYCHDHPHVPAAEGGVSPFDPRLGVVWPLPVGEISERDRAHPLLAAAFEGIAP